MNILNKMDGKVSVLKTQLWNVAVDTNESCTLSFVSTSGLHRETLHLNAGWSGAMILWQSTIEVISGEIAFCPVDLSVLSRLQVFIDKWAGNPLPSLSNSQWGMLEIPEGFDLSDSRKIEAWWLKNIVNNKGNNVEIECFSNLLRKTENYSLVQYLLDEFNNNKSIVELSKQYGLSVSHFRRLSKVALGNTTKNTFHDWRISGALLDLVMTSGHNFTDIALSNGYASLSHFSHDVKSTLGLSPKSLIRNILDS